MMLRGYCVYDSKALVYNAPFFTHTDGSALRMLQDLARDQNTSVARHPEDYSLWFAGVFDDSTGIFQRQVPLMHVADAHALLTQVGQLALSNGEARESV